MPPLIPPAALPVPAPPPGPCDSPTDNADMLVDTPFARETVVVAAGAELVAPATEDVVCVWAADIACLIGKGSYPLDEMVTLGAMVAAAEEVERELTEVAEADLMREEEVAGGWGVLGEAP